MILFKLEMHVSDHFGGKYSHWTFLDALEMSNDTSLHKTASFDLKIINFDRAVFAGFADKNRTKYKNEIKRRENVYVDLSTCVLGTSDWLMMSFCH